MDEIREEPQPEYHEPEVEEWGSVTELTQTGLTNPGNDAKVGSRPSQGV